MSSYIKRETPPAGETHGETLSFLGVRRDPLLLLSLRRSKTPQSPYKRMLSLSPPPIGLGFRSDVDLWFDCRTMRLERRRTLATQTSRGMNPHALIVNCFDVDLEIINLWVLYGLCLGLRSGMWGWKCKSSMIEKENCALRCVSPVCYDLIYGGDPVRNCFPPIFHYWF